MAATLLDWPAWVVPNSLASLTEHDGALVGPAGERFAVVGGVPRFVPNDNYADSFGHQWKRFRKTQLDSYSGLSISRERLERCLGPDAWRALSSSVVLECGCGAGRFTEVLLEEGARVMSVDLSDAVDANVENFPLSDRHRVAQADIAALPFAPGQFQVVICIGVIQHTPSPEKTIEALWNQVAPGGWLVIDHYTSGHDGMGHSVKPFVRAYLKRKGPREAMAATDRLVDVFLPMHRATRGFYPLWFLLCRISPITTYYRTFPQLNDDLQREFALLDTHDSLTDYFKHIRTQSQLRDVLAALGGVEIWTAPGGNGVEARARRAV
jgi:SAM-dependent methyltransferase